MSEKSPIKLTSGGVIHPDYLAHAKQSFLAENECEAFIAACGRPLRTAIRVNRLKVSIEEFNQIAAKYGWGLETIPWCDDGFWLDLSARTDLADSTSIGNLPEHIQGLFYIQEASSMLPPMALLKDRKTDQTDAPLLVDMAAAPGSKTTQLAMMLQNRGMILANELSASRLKFLAANLTRCGVLNTAMSHLDAAKIGDYMPEQFDYVLLDAPCGGEGTVRKDIQALKNWSLDKVKEISLLQKKLILSGYAALKPGGRMVYSTCTLSAEENQQIANYLLENSDANVVPLDKLFNGAEKAVDAQGFLLLLPQQFDSEGFFVACFEKPLTTKPPAALSAIYSSPFEPVNKKTGTQIKTYYRQHFGLDIELDGFELLQRNNEVWLFPQAINRLNPFIKINRAGLKIAQIYPNKIRSSHEFAMAIGAMAKQQTVELDKTSLQQFLRGENISCDALELNNGEVLLCYAGKPVGLGQNQKGKIKNLLPRDLVKDNFIVV